MTSALSNGVFGSFIPTFRAAPWLLWLVCGIGVSVGKLPLRKGRGQQWTTARNSPPSAPSPRPRCRNNDILGRFGAGAALKAALAKIEIDVVFGYVGQTSIGICRSHGGARQFIQVH